MLKQGHFGTDVDTGIQPPSGGCVLKPCQDITLPVSTSQPPSGGCVLKHHLLKMVLLIIPAAFGRLCVETLNVKLKVSMKAASRLRAAVC